MRRLLVLAAVAAALAGVSAPADAACRPVTSNAGVCYGPGYVDPYCSDHHQMIHCRLVDDLYVPLSPR